MKTTCGENNKQHSKWNVKENIRASSEKKKKNVNILRFLWKSTVRLLYVLFLSSTFGDMNLKVVVTMLNGYGRRWCGWWLLFHMEKKKTKIKFTCCFQYSLVRLLLTEMGDQYTSHFIIKHVPKKFVLFFIYEPQPNQ